MRTRPWTAAGVQPTSSTVSSIPGIDRAAPERTETSSGRRRSPNRLPVAFSRNSMPSVNPSVRSCLRPDRPHDRGTELDRQHEGGGTGRPSAAMRARLAALAPTARPNIVRSIRPQCARSAWPLLLGERSASTCSRKRCPKPANRSVARSSARASSRTDSAVFRSKLP